MADFEIAFKSTVKEEGGYGIDSNGAEVAFGINRKHNPDWDGWKDIDDLKANKADVNKTILADPKLLTSAKKLYKERYYDVLNIDKISDQTLANNIFDFSVNSGHKDAEKLLKKLSGNVMAMGVDDNVVNSINVMNVLPDFVQARRNHINGTSLDDKTKETLQKRVDRVSNTSSKPMEEYVGISKTGFDADLAKRKATKEADEIFNDKLVEQYGNQDAAGFWDKTDSFLKQAVNGTLIQNVAESLRVDGTGLDFTDKLFGVDRTEDKEWKKAVGDDTTVDYFLEAYKLDPNVYFSKIKATKNSAHFDELIEQSKSIKYVNETVANTLGDFGKAAASITGIIVADPTNLAIPLAIPFRYAQKIKAFKNIYDDAITPAFKSEQIDKNVVAAAKVAYDTAATKQKRIAYALSGALTAGVPALKYNTDENYRIEDYLFDTIFYGADMGFLKMYAKSTDNARKAIFDEKLSDWRNAKVEARNAEETRKAEEFRTIRDETIQKQYDSINKDLKNVYKEMEEIMSNPAARKSVQGFDRYIELLLKERNLSNDVEELGKVIKLKNETELNKTFETIKKTFKQEVIEAKEVAKQFKEKPLKKRMEESGVKIPKKEGVSKTAKVKVSKDGKVEVTNEKGEVSSFETKGKKAILPTAVVLAILGSEAQLEANSGESSGFSMISYMALAAFGYMGYKVVKGVGRRMGAGDSFVDSLKSMYKGSAQTITGTNKIGISNNPNAVGNAIENTARALNNRAMDTITPLLNSSSPKIKSVARKLFYNAEDGTIHSTERRKTQIVGKLKDIYADQIQETFDKWYTAENAGVSLLDGIKNLTHKNKVFSDMRKQASYAINNPEAKVSKEVKEMASKAREVLQKTLTAAKEAGVDGLKELENYTPYYKKISNMREILIRGGQEAEDKLRSNLMGMLTGSGVPPETAEQVVKLELGRFKQGARSITGKEDTELFDDIANRFKQRYNLDFSQWEDFTANGYKVELGDYIELDISITLDKYIGEMAGHIALANSNPKWTKYAKVFDEIEQAGGTIQEQKELNEIVDQLLGRGIIDHSSNGAKAASIGKNASSFVMLPLAVVNMVQETAKLAYHSSRSKGAMGYMLNRLTNGFVSHGYDSAVVKALLDYHPYGAYTKGKHLSFKGYYDSLSNPMTDTQGVMDDLVSASETLRDRVFMYNGMGKLNSLLEQVSVVTRSNSFARYIHGKETYSDLNKEIWGITKQDENLLKDVLQLNSKGHLKEFDINKFTKEQREAYDRIIDNMKLTDVQEHTAGGTPAWSRNSEIGYAFSALLGFPMQAYSTHGMRLTKGMARGNMEAYLETMIWFTGGFAAYSLKRMIQGKEVNEDDALAYAVMMLPMAAPLSLAPSLLNPAAVSTVEEVATAPMNILVDIFGN